MTCRGLALACLIAAVPASAAAAEPDRVPGEVIVRYEPGAGAAERAGARADAEVSVEENLLLPRTQVVETEAGQTVDGAIRALEGEPGVAYAEPNYLAHVMATPNDDFFGFNNDLWGLHNDGALVNGSTTASDDADIDAQEAWDIGNTSTNVKTAVLDTGITADHVEFGGDRLVNLRDEVHGGTAPVDSNFHGTHVAGTIGAAGNNGEGVTGVSWDARIMPVQVCDASGSCAASDIADGIMNAVADGADVVNMSLGGSFFSQARYDAIQAASGVLFVVAAGNEGTNNDTDPRYPCMDDQTVVFPADLTRSNPNGPLPNLICVAATGPTDARASFSNFGASSVDIAAPGELTLSAFPTFLLPLSEDFTAAGPVSFDHVPAGSPDASLFELQPTGGAGNGPSITDTAGAEYAPNTTATVTSGVVDLTGMSECRVQARVSQDAENDDILRAQVSTGGAFVTVFQRGGDVSATTLSGEALQLDNSPTAQVRFTFTADAGADGAGTTIDDVAIRCPGPAGAGEYRFSSGTSMATPHVAGVASVLLAENPTMIPAQLKATILAAGNWDLATGFGPGNPTLTNGRMNMNEVLASVDSTPPQAFALAAPADNATSTGASPTFNWAASADPETGIDSYSLIVDGAVSRSGITGTSATPGAPLPNGARTWKVRAFNNAGMQMDSGTERTINIAVPDPPPAGGGGGGTAGGGGGGAATPVATPTLPGSNITLPVGKVVAGATTAAPGGKAGSVVKLTVPGPGRIGAIGKSGVFIVAKGSASPKKAGGVALTLKPSSAGKKMLKKKRKLAITVELTFTGSSGQTSETRFKSTLHAAKKKP